MTHYPMTKEQCISLNQELEKIMQSLGEITTLLNACYGSKDPRVTRAGESQAALQRLLWALERQGQPFPVGDGADSPRVRQTVQMNVKAAQ